jgi:hypothetical protein
MAQHPELKPLAKLHGYEVLKRFRDPIHIVEITNDDVSGAADFSARSIGQRREKGYAAATAKIENPKAA